MESATNKRDRLSRPQQWEQMYRNKSEFRPALPDPMTRAGTRELVWMFEQYLQPSRKGMKLLEMGCGASAWLPWFALKYGYSPHGIDYSPLGCALARDGLSSYGVSGDIHCADFANLDPATFHANYDVVTSFGVVEHFENPSAVLRRFCECLRPGGYMLTFVPSLGGLAGRALKRMDPTLYETHKVFNLQQFKDYHSSAGLEVVVARYSEWLDFQFLPFDRFGKWPGLIAKNAVHWTNRIKLLVLNRAPSFAPQSQLLCSAMVAIARRP